MICTHVLPDPVGGRDIQDYLGRAGVDIGTRGLPVQAFSFRGSVRVALLRYDPENNK